jgi:Chalcone isomerase-like
VKSGAGLTRRTMALLLASMPLHAWASRATSPPPELKGELSGALLLGEGRLRFLGMHIYDVRLWGEGAQAAREPTTEPLALELQYARVLSGRAIAERALGEMQAIDMVTAAQAERWLAQMQQIFPDVKAGDRITGVQRPLEATRFFFNGQPGGEVRDAQFTRLFFGIWLSPRSSQPRLREALLGKRGSAS